MLEPWACPTFSVRRMFLDFATKLWDVLPPTGASCVVQLLDVALGLLALRGILRRRKLPSRAMTLLLMTSTTRNPNIACVLTTIVIVIVLSR